MIKTLRRLLGSKTRLESPKTLVSKKLGMVSAAEMAFYQESSACYVGREGAIVDLGCWLGATSIALAKGLLSEGRNADDHHERVVGFDLFEWQDWMPARLAHCCYLAGESFLPEARRVVSEHGGGKVHLVKADLRYYKWDGGPIKLLLVDVMKTEDLSVQVARSFFPHLSKGGLLIHQDFKHYFTGWIHIINYRLREHFRVHRSVPQGTVAFEVVETISRDAVEHATEFKLLLDREIDDAFRYSLGLVKPQEQVNIAAAHVTFYVHLKRRDAAARAIEIYKPDGLLDRGEFPKALDLFRQM